MASTARWGARAAIVLLLTAAGAAGSTAVPDLAGTWAMIQIYPEIATFPFVGDLMRTSIVGQLVNVEQTRSRLIMTDRYCVTSVDDGTPLVRTEIPDAFMAALRPAPRSATLEAAGGAFRFVQPEYIEVRGALLSRPEEDPLPAGADDPRVTDPDGDGRPGLTVRVAILGLIEGEVYVVQRIRYRLSGIVVDPETIRGGIEWTNEQHALGGSNPLLHAQTPSRPAPDRSAHRFLMIRVPAAYSCEDLRQDLAELRERARDG